MSTRVKNVTGIPYHTMNARQIARGLKQVLQPSSEVKCSAGDTTSPLVTNTGDPSSKMISAVEKTYPSETSSSGDVHARFSGSFLPLDGNSTPTPMSFDCYKNNRTAGMVAAPSAKRTKISKEQEAPVVPLVSESTTGLSLPVGLESVKSDASGVSLSPYNSSQLGSMLQPPSLSPRGRRIVHPKKRRRDTYERSLKDCKKGSEFTYKQSKIDALLCSRFTASAPPNGGTLSVENVSESVLIFCFRYLTLNATFVQSVPLVCKQWHKAASSQLCWSSGEETQSPSTSDLVGKINWANFTFLPCNVNKTGNKRGAFHCGTEGDCFKSLERSTGKMFAIKRARVYPGGEGVPYYMLRELSFLENLRHPHISQLQRIHLRRNKLYCFFDFVPCTMYDLLNPNKNPNGGKPLAKDLIKIFMRQLVSAVAYCHRRGVVHRNLKPKHLLIKIGPGGDLSTACLQISDFALVRSTSIPLRTYTTEVVTLWYRAPEVLMGDRYFLPVDVWSVGCIFAEMGLGRPLFPGICEIDQLFQIFSTLGTPVEKEWPEFRSMPNYKFSFPNWKAKELSAVLPGLPMCGRDLLASMLTFDPRKRITAEDSMAHAYLNNGIATIDAPCADPASCSFPPVRGLRALGLVPGEAGIHPTSGFTERRAESMVAGYGLQFLGHYHAFARGLEAVRYPFRGYLSSQTELRQDHRALLVDWLVEVVDVFEMSTRSAFLAVQYVDQFLGTTVIKRSRFQLLGATCLHIASKCEDVSYIGVDDLAVCADHAYLSEHILELEEQVLNCLRFQLSRATVLDFVNIYIEHCPYVDSLDRRVALVSRYLAELSLQEYDLSVSVRPSKVAVCCIVRALESVQKPPWEAWLSAISGYRWSSVEQILSTVRHMHERAALPSRLSLMVIRKRFMKSWKEEGY